MNKEIYKVVHKRGQKRYSAIINHPDWEIEYRLNEYISYPHSPGIFTFNNPESALMWAKDVAMDFCRKKTLRKDVGHGVVEVWKGEGKLRKNQNIKKLKSIFSWFSYKKRGNLYSPLQDTLFDTAVVRDETLFAKSVILQKKLWECRVE